MTTTPLTLSELPALRALGEKATPGPWRLYNERLRQQFPGKIIEVQHDGEYAVVSWMGFEESLVLKKQHRANAAFIAASRDALPRACATIEAQAKTIAERDAEIARLREALQPFTTLSERTVAMCVACGQIDDSLMMLDFRRARAALAKEPT